MAIDRRQLSKFLPDHESIRQFEKALKTVDVSQASLEQLAADLETVAADLASTQSELDAHEALESAHGVSGEVVGTSDTQVLSNKTLDSPAILGVVDLQGGKIKFPASQSSSADPNTLDDYEEGTWTPIVTPASGSITTYLATGYYTKIGRIVTATFDVSITSAGTGAGALTVSLPTPIAIQPIVGYGRELTMGSMIVCYATVTAASVLCVTYNNLTAIATGNRIVATINYCG